MIEIKGIRLDRTMVPSKTVIVIDENHLLYPHFEFTDKLTLDKERYYNYFTRKLAHRKDVKDYFDMLGDIYIECGHIEIHGYHAVPKSLANESSWLYVIEDELVKVIREKRKKLYNKN